MLYRSSSHGEADTTQCYTEFAEPKFCSKRYIRILDWTFSILIVTKTSYCFLSFPYWKILDCGHSNTSSRHKIWRRRIFEGRCVLVRTFKGHFRGCLTSGRASEVCSHLRRRQQASCRGESVIYGIHEAYWPEHITKVSYNDFSGHVHLITSMSLRVRHPAASCSSIVEHIPVLY